MRERTEKALGLGIAGWDAAIFGTIVAIGLIEAVVVARYPGAMPLWMPYEFSWGVYLACAGTVACYVRGIRRTSKFARPGPWRKTAFFIGVGLIYISMQTWLDYAAQHMFFIHRFQHLLLHHTGPFLIALSNPVDMIWRGLPAPIREIFGHRLLRKMTDILQQPVLASFLFVALIYLWPIPSVHFWAMLDPWLYTVMNWSVTIDGILFWALILDPRPKPLARLSYGARLISVAAVMFPQMLLGAIVAFAERDIYPVYDICGRILPMTGLQDQTYAGLILWVPSSMMSVVGAIFILNFIRIHEEAVAEHSDAKIFNA